MSVQEQFEAIASNIISEAQRRLAYHSHGKGRVDVLNDMKAELLALKSAYEGLLSGPIMDVTFAQAMKLELQ